MTEKFTVTKEAMDAGMTRDDALRYLLRKVASEGAEAFQRMPYGPRPGLPRYVVVTFGEDDEVLDVLIVKSVSDRHGGYAMEVVCSHDDPEEAYDRWAYAYMTKDNSQRLQMEVENAEEE